MDFKVIDFGVDFVGFNLYKWMGVLLGVGVFYICKDWLVDIDFDSGNGVIVGIIVESCIYIGIVDMVV